VKADEYKKLCDRPNVFSRRDLETTGKILREKNHPVGLAFSEILQTSPLSKPEKHKGDKSTDYFLIDLEESDAAAIVDHLLEKEADSIEENGETTPLARLLRRSGRQMDGLPVVPFSP
jgi:hypothetical protein